jgi:hypothetical protein
MSDQLVAEAATYTTHNKPKGRIYMPWAGLEPTIPAVKRFDTYALDRTATGIYEWNTDGALLSVLTAVP